MWQRLGIKVEQVHFNNMSYNSLTYIVGDNEKKPVTMNVYQSERYESALIVQQLVGTLVYYSNQGQYKPRLAKSWYPGDKNDWIFELEENLICENNEAITGSSYRKSLEQTLKVLGKNGFPIFEKLIGFQDFVSGKTNKIEGLKAVGNKIIFQFTEAIYNGLVQMLSFSSFGYISQKNLNPDGTWKDNQKFSSSGPYKIKSINLGKEYIITKNENWSLPRGEQAPDEIKFLFSKSNDIPEVTPNFIVDIVGWKNVFPDQLNKFEMVPEYMNAILIGNTESGFFSSNQNREYFRYLINQEKMKFKWPLENLIPSNTFYPNQTNIKIPLPEKFEFETQRLKKEILIQGTEPSSVSGANLTWSILKKVLDDNHINYKFNAKTSWQDASDNGLDIRMRQVAIGGGIEVWGLSVIFCSELGNRLPDPSNTICDLIQQVENKKINFDYFEKSFFDTVVKDSAILPIYHSGTEIFLSDGIDTNSINPTLNIIKFDQLRLK